MSRQVKISIDLKAVNNRASRANGRTCLRLCPKLDERNDSGIAFRQIRFCPIKAVSLMADTAICPYGERLIASRQVAKSVKKAKSSQTRVNGPTDASKKSR